MSEKETSNSISLVAVGCCLLAVGSGTPGMWKYLFDGGAVVLCLIALISELRRRP
jgi:hypothetical protein